MSFDSSEAAALKAQIPGTKEYILKQLADICGCTGTIAKEAEQFRSAVGPRGAPVMVNPKTGEKEYGHNAKRIQHVKEHGDKREDGGEYRRTKDLQAPHGHDSEIQEKGLFDSPRVGPKGDKASRLGESEGVGATQLASRLGATEKPLQGPIAEKAAPLLGKDDPSASAGGSTPGGMVAGAGALAG